MVVYEQIEFETWIIKEYFFPKIALHNYVLYYGDLTYNGSVPKDGTGTHRFSNRKWVLSMCSAGNLCISDAS